MARHYLQELMENARLARNALDPMSGVMAVTDAAWQAQWNSLRKDLDRFTDNVKAGRETTGLWPGGPRE